MMGGSGYTEYPQYRAVAVYYEESDRLEYVRSDAPAVYRRIDEVLTLVLAMDTREPIGFQVKGFRNFYIRLLHSKKTVSNDSFLSLISVVETALGQIGDRIFEESERNLGYRKALDIAEEDKVAVTDLPSVA